MRNDFTFAGFTQVESYEGSLVFGGVDKRAQDALYTIGYILGVLVRLVASIFSLNKDKMI